MFLVLKLSAVCCAVSDRCTAATRRYSACWLREAAAWLIRDEGLGPRISGTGRGTTCCPWCFVDTDGSKYHPTLCRGAGMKKVGCNLSCRYGYILYLQSFIHSLLILQIVSQSMSKSITEFKKRCILFTRGSNANVLPKWCDFFLTL